MKIWGICKARNEAHIIQDTLDNWATFCDRILIYDDCSHDPTAKTCEAHPAVYEVIRSNRFDDDRQRSEWYNRQVLLMSAKRFMAPEDWIVYFDADEHLYGFDRDDLTRTPAGVIGCQSFDIYITPEDQHLEEDRYRERRWVGPEFEICLYFYRNFPGLRFHIPDQRHMTIGREVQLDIKGKILHWGQGISVANFERKVDYYTHVFGPKYADKWEKRRGKAVQHDMKSRYGNPLVLWEDVKAGTALTRPSRGLEMVK